jgi:hypothetical protein
MALRWAVFLSGLWSSMMTRGGAVGAVGAVFEATIDVAVSW